MSNMGGYSGQVLMALGPINCRSAYPNNRSVYSFCVFYAKVQDKDAELMDRYDAAFLLFT